MKNKSAEKIKLTSYDDLFGTKDNSVEGIYTTVALSQLHPFKNHPFKVLDDEKMQETVESVIQHGSRTSQMEGLRTGRKAGHAGNYPGSG